VLKPLNDVHAVRILIEGNGKAGSARASLSAGGIRGALPIHHPESCGNMLEILRHPESGIFLRISPPRYSGRVQCMVVSFSGAIYSQRVTEALPWIALAVKRQI
jgi:hypothetical protein